MVGVTMTLTAPACPAAQSLPIEVVAVRGFHASATAGLIENSQALPDGTVVTGVFPRSRVLAPARQG